MPAPTLAEDFLQLILDDDSGKRVVGRLEATRGLAGAVLVDLVQAGRVAQAEEEDDERTGRFVVRDASPTGDPVWDEALERLGDKPRTGRRAVEKLVKGAETAVRERLVERGVVRQEEPSVLGVFPTKRWPASDSRHEEQLMQRIESVLAGGAVPDQRTADLIALLHAVRAAHKVIDGDRKTLKARAEEIAEDNPGGDAVRRAVHAVRAVVVTVATSGAGV
ncbi:GPP34 family phosphoprotein [Streptomyces sp. WMMB303]|uniref:GOLPH3/VPS74 family protein n=1 Tax=Streptomyces sp. WMMB303 TaxID=3034154 RepID=UPI0023EAC87B|nr:GPP34 family phosphoprotein [Streptomyces sp. WMMB303]MDF4251455.1 GPP34 family phosphoprotein [Streptomyces sp. WMMB303]